MAGRVGHSLRTLTVSAWLFAIFGAATACLTFTGAPDGYRLLDVVIAVFFLVTSAYFSYERRAALREERTALGNPDLVE